MFTSVLCNNKEKKQNKNNQNNKTRVQVTLDVEKKPQTLSIPSYFSEYTITPTTVERPTSLWYSVLYDSYTQAHTG